MGTRPSENSDRAREVLEAWRSALRASHGDEGIAMVTTIARRAGLTRVGGGAQVAAREAPVDAELDAAIAALEQVLRDGAELTRWWRALEQADADQVVVVRVGTPDPAKLDEHAGAFAADTDAELPASCLAAAASTLMAVLVPAAVRPAMVTSAMAAVRPATLTSAMVARLCWSGSQRTRRPCARARTWRAPMPR